MEKFAEWIKKNMPHTYKGQIAADLGITRHYLSNLFGGKKPGIETALKIYFYTNSEVDWKDLIDSTEYQKIRDLGSRRKI